MSSSFLFPPGTAGASGIATADVSAAATIDTTTAPDTPSAPTKTRQAQRHPQRQRSLEQTLELLEARFTQPLPRLLNASGSATAAYATTTSFSNLENSQQSNMSEHSFGFHMNGGTNSGSAYVGRLSTSPTVGNGASMTTALAASTSATMTTPPNRSTRDGSNLIPPSTSMKATAAAAETTKTARRLSLPSTYVAGTSVTTPATTSSSQSPSLSPPTYDDVARATTRHMRKVAATTGTASSTSVGSSSASSSKALRMDDGMKNDSNEASDDNNDDDGDDGDHIHDHDHDNNNSQQNTILAGNLNKRSSQAGTVVAESPPIVDNNSNSISSNSSSNNNNNGYGNGNGSAKEEPTMHLHHHHHQQPSSGSKRKPAQPKRKASSIQDRLLNEKESKTGPAAPKLKESNLNGTPEQESKETDVTPPPPKIRKLDRGAGTTNNKNDIDQSSNVESRTNVNSTSSRSPRIRFLSSSSSNTDSRSNHHSNGPRSIASSNTTGGTRNCTTNGNISRGSGGNTSAASSAPPPNNRRIHDFFSAVGSKNKRVQNGNTSNGGKGKNGASHGGKIDHKRLQGGKSSPTTMNNSLNEELLQAQCEKLQQQLQDKEEQLRAVTNNRTIKHTALQSALTQAKEELRVVQETSERKSLKFQSVIEDLVRSKALKDAKEVRSVLASDGARLGRLIHVRVGMRVIDQWEDGYATHDLYRRKKELQKKKDLLLTRQKEHKKRLKQLSTSSSKPSLTMSSKDDEMAPDDREMSHLEAQEAKESIQMHLEAVKRDENELLLEEVALNEEKAAHTRAMKLVAAEDASTFSARPKLNDRYVLDKLLGKGGFSEVWKAYDLDELREVAVKIHQLDPRWSESKKENYIKHVTREYEIHRQVRHPRIVSFYDVFEIDEDSFATVLEVCSGKDLDTLLKTKRMLPEKQARAILLQILSGMLYLSQPSETRQGIIHYDLKPGNILFDDVGDAKITDFGLSKIVDSPDPAMSMELTSQGAGTYWYLPPECFVMDENVRISNKVDVFSIGVIFYQMLFGRRPFGEGKSQDKILADNTMLNADEVHFPDRPAVSDSCKDFIRLCLTHDQAFRPTISQLCEQPYVLQQSLSTQQQQLK